MLALRVPRPAPLQISFCRLPCMVLRQNWATSFCFFDSFTTSLVPGRTKKSRNDRCRILTGYRRSRESQGRSEWTLEGEQEHDLKINWYNAQLYNGWGPTSDPQNIDDNISDRCLPTTMETWIWPHGWLNKNVTYLGSVAMNVVTRSRESLGLSVVAPPFARYDVWRLGALLTGMAWPPNHYRKYYCNTWELYTCYEDW